MRKEEIPGKPLFAKSQSYRQAPTVYPSVHSTLQRNYTYHLCTSRCVPITTAQPARPQPAASTSQSKAEQKCRAAKRARAIKPRRMYHEITILMCVRYSCVCGTPVCAVLMCQYVLFRAIVYVDDNAVGPVLSKAGRKPHPYGCSIPIYKPLIQNNPFGDHSFFTFVSRIYTHPALARPPAFATPKTRANARIRRNGARTLA